MTWLVASRYRSVEAVCERHEGLVRLFGRAFAKPGSVFLDSEDLQQELRAVRVDVWSRHGHRSAYAVDKIVKTAMKRAIWTQADLFKRAERQHDAALVVFEMRDATCGGFAELFEHYFDMEVQATLSHLSRTVLRELVAPSPQLHQAMVRAAVLGQRGIQPIARYFGLPPWMLRSALREIREVFADFFELPVKSLRLTYLYR
mgnify:CR=1 FL=1